MSAISPINTHPLPTLSQAAAPADRAASSTSTTPLSQQDKVELSLTGRIALGVQDGKLTSAQGQQLYSQLKNINQQITAGATDISTLQGQLSQSIYGDTHNGATIPPGTTLSAATERDFIEAGRVAVQQDQGNLTSAQADQFFSQISQIGQQQAAGTAAQTISQLQDQLSTQIYDTSHNITPSS